MAAGKVRRPAVAEPPLMVLYPTAFSNHSVAVRVAKSASQRFEVRRKHRLRGPRYCRDVTTSPHIGLPFYDFLTPAAYPESIVAGGGATVPARVLQISFKVNVSGDEYRQAMSPVASAVAAVAGLRWKIWIMNESNREAGGIYLFNDEASATAYLEGPIVAQAASSPAISDVSAKQFDVMEDLTVITCGPVEQSGPA